MLSTNGTAHQQDTPSHLRFIESLAEKGKRIAKAMGDAARGPLIIAREVVEIADNWESHKAQAGGGTCAAWLTAITGNPKRDEHYFRRREDAVQRIGEHARRCWHHEAAVWACENIGDASALTKLDRAVMAEKRARGNQPQSVATVKRLARALGLSVVKPRAKVCQRCEALVQALVAAGLPVPE
jgi:hypothetical protein